MDNEKQSDEPQADVQKLSDDAIKDVNGGWGPITNRFFDQFLSGDPKGEKDAGRVSGQIKK